MTLIRGIPVVRLLRHIAIICLGLSLAVAWTSGNTQQRTEPDNNQSAREWLDFKRARYAGQPILLHLRNGYERAVIMPEPIRLYDDSQFLPGCAIAIAQDVIGFFPTHTFDRKSIKFQGLSTDTTYELRVRASPEGIEQSLQIFR